MSGIHETIKTACSCSFPSIIPWFISYFCQLRGEGWWGLQGRGEVRGRGRLPRPRRRPAGEPARPAENYWRLVLRGLPGLRQGGESQETEKVGRLGPGGGAQSEYHLTKWANTSQQKSPRQTKTRQSLSNAKEKTEKVSADQKSPSASETPRTAQIC